MEWEKKFQIAPHYVYLANSSGIHTNWVKMKDYRYDLASMAECIHEYTKVIYLANPDNPTGTYLNKDDLHRLFSNIPKNVIVVIDGAYAEYVNDENYDKSKKG